MSAKFNIRGLLVKKETLREDVGKVSVQSCSTTGRLGPPAPAILNCLRMNKRCCSIDPPAWSNAVQKEPATIFQLPLGRPGFEAGREASMDRFLPLSSSPGRQGKAARQSRANPTLWVPPCAFQVPTPPFPSNCFHSPLIIFHLLSPLSLSLVLSWRNSSPAHYFLRPHSSLVLHCDIPFHSFLPFSSIFCVVIFTSFHTLKPQYIP